MFVKWKRLLNNFDYEGFIDYKNKKYLVFDIKDFGHAYILEVEYYSNSSEWLFEWHRDSQELSCKYEINFYKKPKLHWEILQAFRKLPLTHEKIVITETNREWYNRIKYRELG